MKQASAELKRLVLVDDHWTVRDGLRYVIEKESDLIVCGEAESAVEALAVVEKTKPHLAIVDLSLRNSCGLELLKDLRALHPGIATMVCSVDSDPHFVRRAFQAGARGYLDKVQARVAMVPAVRQVLAGETYLPPHIAVTVTGAALTSEPVSEDPVARLSDRELQVFQLLGQGHSAKEIAGQTNLSHKTVEDYRLRIRDKLRLRDSQDVFRAAVLWTHGRNGRDDGPG